MTNVDHATAEAIREIGDLAITGVEPYYVEKSEEERLVAVVTAPEGYQTTTLDLEKLRAPYRGGPVRKRGQYDVRDVASFLAYYEKHAQDTAEIWVAPDCITAVLNANGGLDGAPAWEDHRLTLKLQFSVEWRRWQTMSGVFYSQQDFATMLDDAVGDIAEPDMATVLEVASSLEAAKQVQFESAFRTDNGQRGFKYIETITARAGQKGQLDIPEKFILRVRVFEGQEPILIPARFRYRLNGDNLKLGIVIDRMPEVVEAALADVNAAITESIQKGTVFTGPAPRVLVP